MLWYRISLSEDGVKIETPSSRLLDNGPGRAPSGTLNKIVLYTRTSVPESAFIEAHAGYRLEERINDSFKFTRLDSQSRLGHSEFRM
jgi:hypothetical protein